jgi:hypothetical protein
MVVHTLNVRVFKDKYDMNFDIFQHFTCFIVKNKNAITFENVIIVIVFVYNEEKIQYHR